MTKTQLVSDIFLAMSNRGATRADIVKQVAKQLNVSSACASTHVSNAAKKYEHTSVKTRTVKKVTKKSLAIELFNTNSTLDRNQMIDLFKIKLNMSENSAATHYWLVQKHLGENT